MIEAKVRALSDASASMAQRLYANQPGGGAGGGRTGGGTGGGGAEGGGDNVVDAEFEEVKDEKKSA